MERERREDERGGPEDPAGGEQDARVDRQDATGIAVPAGRAAKDVRPEEYRPAEILDDHGHGSETGDRDRGRS